MKIIEPDNGQTNIPIYPTIRLHFSKQVQNVAKDTIELHKNSTTGPEVLISSISSINDTDYYFLPIGKLDSATTYVVIVARDVISTDTHDPITGDNTFSFTTGNDIATTIGLLYPGKNAYNVSLTPEIQVQFSREVTNITPDSLVLGSCKKPTCILPEHVPGYTITQDSNDNTKYIITLAKNTSLEPNTGCCGISPKSSNSSKVIVVLNSAKCY